MMGERLHVVRTAESWVGTPYHHRGQIKHAGVDCAMLLYCVWFEAGLLESFPIDDYPPDWHLHRSVERYALKLLEYCTELTTEEEPKPADILLFKFGRAYAHGVIITGYPMGIHAQIKVGTVRTNVLTDPFFTNTTEKIDGNQGKPRKRKVFRFNRWIND